MRNFIFALGLLLVSSLGQAQTLTIENVSLNILKNNKIKLLVNKDTTLFDTTRIIYIHRILDGPKDKSYDTTEVTIGNNEYNLTWDGVKGTYEMIITVLKNGETVVKKGNIKLI
jgi:hypothetical protein